MRSYLHVSPTREGRVQKGSLGEILEEEGCQPGHSLLPPEVTGAAIGAGRGHGIVHFKGREKNVSKGRKNITEYWWPGLSSWLDQSSQNLGLVTTFGLNRLELQTSDTTKYPQQFHKQWLNELIKNVTLVLE